jgi:hypothetical protein
MEGIKGFGPLCSCIAIHYATHTPLPPSPSPVPVLGFRSNHHKWTLYSFSGVFVDEYKWMPCGSSDPDFTPPWLIFNFSFPTSGLRRLALMAQGNVAIYLFPNTFDIDAPCKNPDFVELDLHNAQYMAPIYSKDVAFYSEADTTYYVVFSGDLVISPITGEIWDAPYQVIYPRACHICL